MSFRARLTSFFLLIVVVPMVAFSFLVFRLISDSEQGKAQARVNGLATAAASLYASESAAARQDARSIARDSALLRGRGLPKKLAVLAARAGLARVAVLSGRRTLADTGNLSAIAPGAARLLSKPPQRSLLILASELTAPQYEWSLSAPGVAVAVRQGSKDLASTVPADPARAFPRDGTVAVGRRRYRAVTMTMPSFRGPPLSVTVLSSLSATTAAVGNSRTVAAAFIAAFLLLAFSFAVLVSRALQGQLAGFLRAARRLATGDFSSPIRTHGRDEFAALGQEFNNMSRQLEHRLRELSRERGRLRDAIRRTGETMASKLDPEALLGLALEAAIDAVDADRGSLRMLEPRDRELVQSLHQGDLTSIEGAVEKTEQDALSSSDITQAEAGSLNVVSIPIDPVGQEGAAHAVLTLVREEQPFTEDDHELLRSLAAQASLALENAELHLQVRRQAVTDELTALANHRRFQELLGAEMEQVRRYKYPVGLIMLDIDNFKAVNDTYGHQQGDVVLKQVARVVQDNSREADTPARYGGEEMALILPHTELEGAYAIAERIRVAIEGLRVPRVDSRGFLRTTASVGVAASSEGNKAALIAEADGALYESKRRGKNRTLRAAAQPADALPAE